MMLSIIWFLLLNHSHHLAKAHERISIVPVTITTYQPTESQCDGTPYLTACGFDLRTKGNYIAVSRDLLIKYSYFDTLKLKTGIAKIDRKKWVIVDTMNKRWHNRIDLCVNYNIKIKGVILQR